MECCHIEDEFHAEVHGLDPDNLLDFPHVLVVQSVFDHDENEESDAEYWLQKTTEAFDHMRTIFRIRHVDGTEHDDRPEPVEVGAKWFVGFMPDEDADIDLDDESIVWSNASAECIEKDGEYIWTTSIGDVYVALAERDNASCAYVNGEDVYGCDAPLEPVEPATIDPIEEAEQTGDSTTNLSDNTGDNSGVDTNADDEDNQIVQQLQDASASPAVSKQSFPGWAIPTVAVGVLLLSYSMYICKQKIMRSSVPDIEAPKNVDQESVEIRVEATSDADARDVQIVTQEA